MKLFWKGVLLAAIPSFFEIVALLFLLQAQHDAAIADAWALHSSQVLNESALILEPVLGEAIRFRGAMLAESPSLASDTFWNTLDAEAARLPLFVPDNPSQAQRANQIRTELQRYRLALERSYRIAVDGGHAAVTKRYRPGGGVEVLDRVREEFNDFDREERRLDRLRREDSKMARQRQQYALYVIILLSVVIGIIAVYLFNRSVGLRLAAVSRNAERIGTGEPLEAQVAGNDEITLVDRALHRAAEELKEKRLAQAEAQRELAERAETLSLVNEDLRQQRQDNEMFIYSVSHDLRSPLVNLEGFSKELAYSSQDLRANLDRLALPADAKAELDKILSADFEPALRYVGAAVSQASRIIDALLKLSRVGRLELREEAIDVNTMVASLLDAAAQTIRSTAAKIQVGELPPMTGDAVAIGQVFANLINNAIYYRDPTRENLIEISGSTSGKDVSYSVKDNGLGITAQQQARLFVAFKRFHPEAAKGEGIGLAYVKRVVERHSGRISVVSAEGQGSTFTIFFANRAC